MGQVFVSALTAVLTLLVFMAGGFVFARRGMVKPDFSRQLSGVVFKFFFPLMLLRIILLQTDMAALGKDVPLIAISVVAKRLAMKLRKIKDEGDKQNEPHE